MSVFDKQIKMMEVEAPSAFVERLIAAREAAGKTQDDAAAAIGIGKQSVYKWEMGKVLPDLKSLVKICEVYNTTPNHLLGFDEDK